MLARRVMRKLFKRIMRTNTGCLVFLVINVESNIARVIMVNEKNPVMANNAIDRMTRLVARDIFSLKVFVILPDLSRCLCALFNEMKLFIMNTPNTKIIVKGRIVVNVPFTKNIPMRYFSL